MDSSNLMPTSLQTEHCLIQPELAGIDSDHDPISLDQYVKYLRLAGFTVIDGDNGTFWRQGETGSLLRLPSIDMTAPGAGELKQVTVSGHVAVASYLRLPSAQNPPNALLYLCQTPQYSIETRPKNVRSDIRRAITSLDFAWMRGNDLLEKGFPAYRDSRVRNGLSDGTQAAFERRFVPWVRNPGHHALGAWRHGTLVAFFTVTAVDDWAEVGGHSRHDALQWRPNNGLMHCVLDYYLAQKRVRVVSYGLSSVQEGTNASGLHDFKLRVGFEAIPVHRAFSVHPYLRPLINPLFLQAATGLLRVLPGNRWLRKACGALRSVVNSQIVQSS